MPQSLIALPGCDRTNLATGSHAEATLRAWSVIKYVREQQLVGDAASMAEILSVIRTHVSRWPVSVQRFFFRQLATIGDATPQNFEVHS